MKPLCIDGFCGLGGWAEGFLAEGWRVIGFDIERHDYGTGGYPGQLVLQDMLTLHGSQLKGASCLVFSPPCTEFSYMAMPFSRGKQIAGALRGEVPFPEGYKGSRTRAELTALFDACFRLQREAIEAAGHHIPMVVENVKGAQPWVGPARANYGSFYFWGDVDMVGRRIVAGKLHFGGGLTGHHRKLPKEVSENIRNGQSPARWTNPDEHYYGRKVPGFNFHQFEKTGQPGGSFQTASVNGTKQVGLSGAAWFDHGAAKHSSKSVARKMASAMIAKIPMPLSQHIAKCYKPEAAQ